MNYTQRKIFLKLKEKIIFLISKLKIKLRWKGNHKKIEYSYSVNFIFFLKKKPKKAKIILKTYFSKNK